VRRRLRRTGRGDGGRGPRGERRRRDDGGWIDYAVATGTGHARNLAVVASCEAAIAVGGRWGTAAEIAYARLLGRPVVVLGSGPPVEGEGIERAETPAHAVELALGLAEAR
jgi:uncharacterized protein (TIGR00725 family)